MYCALKHATAHFTSPLMLFEHGGSDSRASSVMLRIWYSVLQRRSAGISGIIDLGFVCIFRPPNHFACIRRFDGSGSTKINKHPGIFSNASDD